MPLGEFFRDLPYTVLYLGIFAGVTEALLFPPYAMVIASIECRRARHQSPYLRSGQLVLLGLVLGAPAALTVAASFAYRSFPPRWYWSEFFSILPHALVTFWLAAAIPPLLVPSLRLPVRNDSQRRRSREQDDVHGME